MFLTIIVASVPVLVLCALAMARQGSTAPQLPAAQAEQKMRLSSSQFFSAEAPPQHIASRLPRDLVLSQIERHVRLEQAAAETFLGGPTPEALHSRTSSPFLN